MMEARQYSEDEHKAMSHRLAELFGIPKDKRVIVELHKFEGVRFYHLVGPENVAGVREFETREDDIVIATYSKSGTHWIYEIVQLIRAEGHSEKIDRSQMLPSTIEMFYIPECKRPTYEIINEKKSPRVFTTHLPWQFLPKQLTEQKKGKVIYVMRNPKDVLASNCRFILGNAGKKKDEEFWKYLFNTFLTGDVPYGSWFDHVEKAWKHRNQENVFFTSYEQMKKDFKAVIKPLSQFLGHELDEDALARVEDKSTVKAMKKTYEDIEKNEKGGIALVKAMGKSSFVVKGVIGSWKDDFTVAENELFDQVCKEKMANWDLDVVFE